MSRPKENPHAGQGSVLLDIGEDVGAIVVTMPPAMDGAEVEIRPVGAAHHVPYHPVYLPVHAAGGDRGNDHDHQHSHSHWPHVAVVARPTPGGIVHSLVFPAVLEGCYELYVRPDGAVQLILDVRGGEVTTAAWPV